jgi:hypothetical protein
MSLLKATRRNKCMGTEESSHITIGAKLPALVTALPRGNTA